MRNLLIFALFLVLCLFLMWGLPGMALLTFIAQCGVIVGNA